MYNILSIGSFCMYRHFQILQNAHISSGFNVYNYFQIRQDVYFMSSQKTKPSLFGLPLIVPCCESTTHQDLYQAVWVQVARLVSPLPPSETAAPNHAQDWCVN
jgi:hypothetical protein